MLILEFTSQKKFLFCRKLLFQTNFFSFFFSVQIHRNVQIHHRHHSRVASAEAAPGKAWANKSKERGEELTGVYAMCAGVGGRNPLIN